MTMGTPRVGAGSWLHGLSSSDPAWVEAMPFLVDGWLPLLSLGMEGSWLSTRRVLCMGEDSIRGTWVIT